MKTLWWLRMGLLLFGACVLVSCGEDGQGQAVAGKPAGSETSEEIAARIVDSDGLPVAGATVRVRPVDFLSELSVSQEHLDLVSDEQGKVVFPVALKGRWMLEARANGKGVVLPFVPRANGGQVLPAMVLRPFGGIRGKVDLPLGTRKAYVRLVGVDRIDSTDTAGYFELQNLSPTDSSLPLRVSRQDDETMIAETLVQIKASETIDLGQTHSPSILLSDFERGLRLGLPGQDARWALDIQAWLRFPVDTMARGHEGNGLRMYFQAGYPGVVFLHANLRGSRNLLGLDSVEIWARGKGGLSLYLTTSASRMPVLLDSVSVDESVSWRRVVIKPWSGFAWRDLLRGQLEQATALSIKFESSGLQQDIAIDDVRLFGVSSRDWN